MSTKSSTRSIEAAAAFARRRSHPRRSRKWFQPKPERNRMGVVPTVIETGRHIKVDLIPRVERLVQGGIIPKPVWLDAARAHPPPLHHKWSDPVKPTRFEWREEDRLRRTWQRRNPAASMHPKVLFLDETQLPPGTKTEHPADEFVRKQLKLMRVQGLSEEEAYRRVAQAAQEEAQFEDEEVAAARKAAANLGLTPAVPDQSSSSSSSSPAASAAKPGEEGISGEELFSVRLLRRFAEEARDAGDSYPKHWFNADGSWRGIGQPVESALDRRTTRQLKDRAVMAEAAEAEAEARNRMLDEADDDENELLAAAQELAEAVDESEKKP